MKIERRKVGQLLMGTLLIGAVIYFGIGSFMAEKRFLNSEYSEKINKIEIRTGHRGHAHVLVDTTWRLLNIEELKIQSYLQPGDSIVKQRGTKTITVFRRTERGLLSKGFD